MAKQYPNIKLLGGPGLNCPAGMNVGIKNAKGKIVCKVDGNGYVEPNFIKMGVHYLESDENIKCAGGPIKPISKSLIEKSNVLARSSVFGVGRGVNTLEEKSGFTDTVQCGIY